METKDYLGLVLAFAGIFVAFGWRPRTAKPAMSYGNILQIAAAVLWGATTLYIKKFMAGKVQPINTFLYQLFFSIPILLIISIFLDPKWFYRVDPYVIGSLFYHSVIIAFATYFVWFKLIHQYSVSRFSAFTFLTPIFGVFFGVLFLHEEFTVSLMIGLPLVSARIFLVNWRRRAVLLT